MPGMYPPGEYDLAGFAVGVVEKIDIIDGASIARRRRGARARFERPAFERLFADPQHRRRERTPTCACRSRRRRTLGDALLAPTRIYVKPVLALMARVTVKGMAHITGGGLVENMPRMLPEQSGGAARRATLAAAAGVRLAAAQGNVADDEMHRVFNCGIGMVHRRRGTAREGSDRRAARTRAKRSWQVGTHRRNARWTQAQTHRSHWKNDRHPDLRPRQQHAGDPRGAAAGFDGRGGDQQRPARRAGSRRRARTASPPRVVDHRRIATAPRSTARLPRRSTRSRRDLVVLAGFMRILTAAFVDRYRGRHDQYPSVAAARIPGPAYAPARARSRRQGARLHRALRDARARSRADRDPGRRAGAAPDDNEDSLAARVLAEEHRIYPQAVRWFCDGRLAITPEGIVKVHAARGASGALVSPAGDA